MSDFFAEAPPEFVVGDEHRDPVVARRKDLRRNDVRMRRVGVATGALACIEPRARDIIQLRKHHVVHGDVHLPALTFDELGEQAHGAHDARRIVDGRVAGFRRRPAGLASELHDAGECLDHIVVRGTLGEGTVQAISGQRYADDVWVPALECLVGEAKFLDRRRAQIGE